MREWNKQVSVACAKAKQRDDPDGSSSVGGPAVNKRSVWRLRLGSSPKESKNKTSNKMFSDDDGGVFLRENDFPGAASGKNSNHHSDFFVLLSLPLFLYLSLSIWCPFSVLKPMGRKLGFVFFVRSTGKINQSKNKHLSESVSVWLC